ncbi:hypothetical protein [Trabulsiella odontotermitis]|uniref:hypothetical protein n=1 Tax=Trabulsiella odontotermitis TaxID=379893 RepID=UPI0012D7F62E|nr:hypothetical protein [Trabulsiella odontotermitis]
MGGSSLNNDLLLAVWLFLFSLAILISAREVIRDHCSRVKAKNKLKRQQNEKRIRTEN